MSLYIKIMTQRISQDDALIEIEGLVRQADHSLNVDLLQALEVTVNYQTYEKVRKAACLVREALNELYDETLKIKGE